MVFCLVSNAEMGMNLLMGREPHKIDSRAIDNDKKE